MQFGCFNGGYDGQALNMQRANLDPKINLWFAIFDFNDEAKTGKNWSLIPQSEYGEPWLPLGPLASGAPDVPLTASGAISVPSQNVFEGTESGGMQSFSFNTSQAEIEAMATDAAVPPPGAPAPPAAAPAAAAPPAESPKKPKLKIGWNPGKAKAAPAAAPPAPPAAPSAEETAAQTAAPADVTLFDKIVAGDIPCDKVYEDDLALCFRDIAPQAATHVIVIPKDRKGLSQLALASEEHKALLGHLMYVASLVARQLALKDGYRVVVNDGVHGCQSVYHLHLHVLGGEQLTWPPGTKGSA